MRSRWSLTSIPSALAACLVISSLTIVLLWSNLTIAAHFDSPLFSSSNPIQNFDQNLALWNIKAARTAISAIPPGSSRQLREGKLAVYEADYRKAISVLRPIVNDKDSKIPSETRQSAEHFLKLAYNANEVFQGTNTRTSSDGHFVAVFADPKDELLALYLFDVMAEARNILGKELGVLPDQQVRFEILADPATLSKLTPLSLENVYTTGTVGITKYNRIMMVSPRIMLRGYGWLDTAVHEYVHYIVTMRTGNAAPVWLQEGLAKLFETRWRTAKAPALANNVASLLRQALVDDELITLAEMHPSIAMLPSQEMAALAYAEVESMLGLLRERKGIAAITALMDSVASGVEAEQSFAKSWGKSFSDFMESWKLEMLKRTASAKKGQFMGRQFRSPTKDDESEIEDDDRLGDIFSHLGGGKARQHARVGVLLALRDHDQAAMIQFEKARRADHRARIDPKLCRRLGELYLKYGHASRALPLLMIAGHDDPENPNLAAAEAEARRLSGDLAGARQAAQRAIRVNPFIPKLHCTLAQISDSPAVQTAERSYCPDPIDALLSEPNRDEATVQTPDDD